MQECSLGGMVFCGYVLVRQSSISQSRGKRSEERYNHGINKQFVRDHRITSRKGMLQEKYENADAVRWNTMVKY